jgi:AraC-like DNA-binding protein
VSIDVVHALFDLVEKAGVSRLQLLREAKLAGHELDAADARVTRAVIYWLCERAIELTGDPALGLHWSETISGNTFAPVSPMIAHSATLRQGLESLAKFDRLLTDATGYELIERDERVVLRCSTLVGESSRIQRFVAEMIVAGLFKLIGTFSAHPRSAQVSFAYPAPSYRAEYARVFMGAEQFEQPFTGLEFDRALMNAVSPHKDEDVHSALRSVAERRLLRLTQSTPYSERVRELLVQRGGAGPTDMDTVASALGLSVRTLRRRLCAEGKPYRSIVNDALAIVAKHQLRSTQRTIQEIAHELGFADASTFHRAFKRRTGMTPQAYRAKQLGSDKPE